MSNFDMAGPFNEMVVMGVLAVRLQSLDRELQWDGPNMKFTNIIGLGSIEGGEVGCFQGD